MAAEERTGTTKVCVLDELRRGTQGGEVALHGPPRGVGAGERTGKAKVCVMDALRLATQDVQIDLLGTPWVALHQFQAGQPGQSPSVPGATGRKIRQMATGRVDPSSLGFHVRQAVEIGPGGGTLHGG